MTLPLAVFAAALAVLAWAHARLHQAGKPDLRLRGVPVRNPRPGPGKAARFCYAVDPLRCTRCEACLKVCPTGALRRTMEAVIVDPGLCQACGRCAERCRRGALLRIRAAA